MHPNNSFHCSWWAVIIKWKLQERTDIGENYTYFSYLNSASSVFFAGLVVVTLVGVRIAKSGLGNSWKFQGETFGRWSLERGETSRSLPPKKPFAPRDLISVIWRSKSIVILRDLRPDLEVDNPRRYGTAWNYVIDGKWTKFWYWISGGFKFILKSNCAYLPLYQFNPKHSVQDCMRYLQQSLAEFCHWYPIFTTLSDVVMDFKFLFHVITSEGRSWYISILWSLNLKKESFCFNIQYSLFHSLIQ